MKTVKFLLASFILFAFTANAQADNKTKEVTFSVAMHCGGCKAKVDKNIPNEVGVLEMKSSLETKEVWVKYDADKTDKAKLKQAIEKLGYATTELTAAKEAEVTFNVAMHCGGCKAKVDKNIPNEAGVLEMKSSLETKEVWVKYDADKTDKAKLKQAIEKLGYATTELAPAKKSCCQ